MVVDASAMVLAVVGEASTRGAARRSLQGMRRHAPHLIDAECGNVLRRKVLRGEIDAVVAGRSRLLAGALVSRRHREHGRLAARAWELREDLSFYDALYVALAEALDCPLVTADRRLAGAPGPRCELSVIDG